jgi:membrane associated rhomboid family serine protease
VPAPVGVLCVDCVRAANKAQRPVRSRLGFKAAQGPPLTTYVLIGLNVAVFVLGPALLGSEWRSALGLWPHYDPSLVPYIDSGDQWWRWVTSAFVHFNFIHIGMNMYVLWQFGSLLEPVLGRARFILLYFGAALGSSALVEFLGTQGSVHGGASGAIFGLFAAYGIVLRKLRLPYQSVAVTAGLWLALGFIVPGLSWQGHLGGAITGAVIMGAMMSLASRKPVGRTPTSQGK